MRPTPMLLIGAMVVATQASARAQVHDRSAHRRSAGSTADSAFAALQKRGALVMGVDQYTSSHQFEALRDGGRIVLVRDVDDTSGVRTIREHLSAIARQFAAGDFSASAIVHARPVPGTDVMRARRRAIRYEFRPLPRGGEVRIATQDPEALRAVHEFLAFQRGDHRTR
ncbi:MAG: hypothetical protein ABR499_09535 [Gemmatimonadaceae bacterium]